MMKRQTPLHEILRQRRVDLVITQQKLAAKMGVAQSMVSDWESGRVSPYYDNIVKWTTALGITLVPTLTEWL